MEGDIDKIVIYNNKQGLQIFPQNLICEIILHVFTSTLYSNQNPRSKVHGHQICKI
jgi:hypothetical protein